MPPDFDPETYINAVLRPLGREGFRPLPDLAVRYALDQLPSDAADEDFLRRVDQVVDLWQRQEEGGTTGLAQVCTRCLVEDDRLRHQAAYRDPRWWRGRVREWQGVSEPSDSQPERPFGSADQTDQPSATDERHRQPTTEPPEPAGPATRPTVLPPADLAAETRDDRVILRWQAPPGALADVTFTIERLSGSGAQQLVAATPGTTIEDSEPPVGRMLTYRVWTEHAASGARSDAALVTVVFTPPVTDLVAGQVRDGRVVGQWRIRPGVWRAEVWRTPHGAVTEQASGATILARDSGFDDPAPPPGRYIYSVVPVYRDPDTDQTYRGRRSEVAVEVFGQPPRPQVSAGAKRRHDSTAVTLRWDELPGDVFLLVRYSPVEPAGSAGDLLMIEEAEQAGQLAWNGRGRADPTVTMPLPAGRWVLVPFAVAGRRAVRGECLHVDVVPPVTSPEAIRHGPDVRVSWVWPNGLRLARVVWRGDGGDVVTREITWSEYQVTGNVTFQRSEAGSIRITGIVRSGADELPSATVTVKVAAQPPTLRYQVKRIPSLPGLLPWSRRRRVVFITDRPCAGLRAVIYAHEGDGDQGSYVQLATGDNLDFGPGRSQVLPVTAPGPCYIWCRATSGFGEVSVDNYNSSGRRIR